MAHFKYTARTKKGEKVDGVVEANDRSAAARQIESMGHMPISIAETTKTHKQEDGTKKRFNFELGFHRKTKMKISDLLLFSRELSDLVASGMTIGQALHTLSRRKDESAKGQIILTLRNEIIQGTSLSDALQLYPETFSTLYVNLVRAGEASGNLPASLENVCQHYERVQEARGKVIEAMTYPAIVMTIGVLAVIVLMIKVVPNFTQIFEDMGAELPNATLMLLSASNFLLSYGLFVLLIIIGAFILFKKYTSEGPGQYWWHSTILKIPIAKGIITANAYTQFARTFGTLLENGVSVLQAMTIVQNTINNVVISTEIGNAKERVTDGSSIAGPLSKGKVFPQLLTDMLSVGEETGDLAASLRHIARRYDTELTRMVKTCTTILEPLLIVLVAIVIGAIVLSLLLPIMTITDNL